MIAEGRGRFRRRFALLALALAGVAAIAVGALMQRPSGAPTHANVTASPIPVTVREAVRRDVPIVLNGLGTVQASNTIAIRSQIDGKLQSVNFVEGQEVHKGDTLAVIDPRALQAALDQAKAKQAQDQAQLVAAQKDLQRFQTLAAKSFETQQ